MTIAAVPVYDATGANASSLPPGHAAGYSTGTGPVPWTAADWAAHPGAVRICQDPGATDRTADVLDVETGAATVADVPGWAEAAAAGFAAARRPGQRHPAIYVNLSNMTAAVNALVHGGIASGVALWIANWNLTEPEAAALVANASGPFPVIGVQYGNRGSCDISVFSAAWLAGVSGDPPPPVPPPPGWAYPAPASLSAVPSRSVQLSWPAVAAQPPHPAPGSYTAAIYDAAGRLLRQTSVAGLGVTVTGLPAGACTAHAWADGGPLAPPHASAGFTL